MPEQAPIFNLFEVIHSLPKKDEDTTIKSFGGTISKILQSDNEDEKKLFLIKSLLINHGLYLEDKIRIK